MDTQVPFPTRRGPKPTDGFMTACEVLTWIACGEARTQQELRKTGLQTALLWGTRDLPALAIALAARTSAAPFCPLEAAFAEPGCDAHLSAFPFCGEEGPETLRAIRRRARRREKKIVSFTDLQAELQLELEGRARDTALLNEASTALLYAVQSERITCYGRTSKDSGHQAIDVTFFMGQPAASITWWNSVAVQRASCLRDVRFKTTEVLASWPAGSLVSETDPDRPLGSPKGLVAPQDRITDECQKPPFDDKQCEYQFAAMKKSGELKSRPTIKEGVAMMKDRFATAPRDRIRKIIVNRWGNGKTGPRNPRNSTSKR